jgi:mannose-1-phosphate guanylyltransferase
MRNGVHRWAIVLAAGDGSRLRSLTTRADGVAIPKQFCSLHGGATLCEWALRRAERHVAPERVTMVVAERHRRWAERELRRRPDALGVWQPENRGTVAGILLPLARVLERDAEATVLVLPSDHFVADERAFARAADAALDAAACWHETLVLVGVRPTDADTELGWILPGRAGDGLHAVDAFVEKPTPELAAELLLHDGLVNTFVFAARGATLLALCERLLPHLTAAILEGSTTGTESLRELYPALPAIDFSRAVLEHAGDLLRVVAAEPCGWSDLGTPARVAACVRRLRSGATRGKPRVGSLAARALRIEAHRRLEQAF